MNVTSYFGQTRYDKVATEIWTWNIERRLGYRLVGLQVLKEL